MLDYGWAHGKTIREAGGMLLGHRLLDEDGGLDVLLGGRSLSQEWAWGSMTIEQFAHSRFGRHFHELLSGDRTSNSTVESGRLTWSGPGSRTNRSGVRRPGALPFVPSLPRQDIRSLVVSTAVTDSAGVRA